MRKYLIAASLGFAALTAGAQAWAQGLEAWGKMLGVDPAYTTRVDAFLASVNLRHLGLDPAAGDQLHDQHRGQHRLLRVLRLGRAAVAVRITS